MSRLLPTSSANAERAPWGWIGVFVYIPLLLILGAAGTFATVRGIPAGDLFRDTTSVVNAPLYVGALSTLGLFLWAAAATLCLFTAALLWQSAAPRAECTFFLGAGLLTGTLLLDDAFLIHESIAPDDLGVSSDVLFAAYAIAAVGLFWGHRQIVWDSPYSILGVGLSFLVAGVVVDFMDDYEVALSALWADTPDLKYYLEDGTKLFGIAGWATYFGWTGYQRLARRLGPSAAGEGAVQRARSARNGRFISPQEGLGAPVESRPRTS